MTAEISMNQLFILCATVFTLYTSLRWGLLSFSVLKVREVGGLPSFDGARTAQFGGLRGQGTSWRRRSYRPGH